jgi:NAD-dependent dihydropyrimidine dehydrogenase PreA subunit
MSDFVLHKGRRPADDFARHYGADVAEVVFDPTRPTRVILDDKREGQGSCLGCSQAPCIEKHPSEQALVGELEAYPGDPSGDVCPPRAISWDTVNKVAVVDSASCIGCGLCVTRCPYGAISLSRGSVATVAASDPNTLVTLVNVKREHAKPAKKGVLARLDAPAAQALPNSVATLGDAKGMLFIRNLFHEVGLNARVRRRGDTNMRIDAVGVSRSGRPFVAEIELSLAVLESPRALLEDVAILHARYGYAVADIDPISVILSFPNVRSEYYQVIDDIEQVLDIRCRSITVGALVGMLWNFSRIDGFSDDAFITKKGAVDLSGSLGIPRRLLVEPYPGAFTPAK